MHQKLLYMLVVYKRAWTLIYLFVKILNGIFMDTSYKSTKTEPITELIARFLMFHL